MRIGEINKDNYMQYSKLLSTLTGGKKNANAPGNVAINRGIGKTDAFGQERVFGADGYETKESIDRRLKKIQLAHPDGSYGIPGMDITGKDPSSWQKIIDVSDDVREKMISIARKDFVNNYGMSDGEEESAAIKKYLWTLPEDKRLSASWTLQQIYRQEAQRLADIVKSKVPGWQYGEPFDRTILTCLPSGSIFDVNI